DRVIPNSVRKAYKIEITEVDDYNKDGAVDLADVEFLLKNNKNTLKLLNGDGDFRSPECIELLKQADIVVTNPPFSLFREYVAQLIEYDKKFIIIGNQNAITYKEIFPLLKNDRIWLGYKSGAQEFFVPKTFEKNNVYTTSDGKRLAKFGNICWYTNLDTTKKHEDLPLYKSFSPQDYPKYDNYDAIEVSKVADIPYDYDGLMGVPITFLDKYNPEQFEIIGLDRYTVPKKFLVGGRVAINGKPCYARILIRRRKK
ncbi:MAG: adenine-specific methyltransferase EcoRI family protein, partial [Candidatus Borkfalkiaceae bacterium]|nr:adenine-specific methyltransferase EcoRI family protein [Christensenellaceae bacterium]